jgi:threonyl-tRNA synthetase
MSEPQSEVAYDFVPRTLSSVETLRHSAAHLMASAVSRLYPGTRFGIGPHIEHGFYYDMEIPKPVSVDDLPAIEELMREIAKGNHRFEHSLLSREEAITWAKETDQPYKLELIEHLEDPVVSLASTNTATSPTGVQGHTCGTANNSNTSSSRPSRVPTGAATRSGRC